MKLTIIRRRDTQKGGTDDWAAAKDAPTAIERIVKLGRIITKGTDGR